jgi:hypothetical protein
MVPGTQGDKFIVESITRQGGGKFSPLSDYPCLNKDGKLCMRPPSINQDFKFNHRVFCSSIPISAGSTRVQLSQTMVYHSLGTTLSASYI